MYFILSRDSYCINFFLQQVKESGSVCTVHLRVMELERYCQPGLEQ